MSIFKLISKAISSNSFQKICIEIFLVKFGLCVKMFCCLFATLTENIEVRLRLLFYSFAVVAETIRNLGWKLSHLNHVSSAHKYNFFVFFANFSIIILDEEKIMYTFLLVWILPKTFHSYSFSKNELSNRVRRKT